MRNADLQDEIRRLLLEADPISICFDEDEGKNVDEYNPEVSAIMEGLPDCTSEEEVLRLVWKVFRRFFGEDIAGPKEKYTEIASKMWQCVVREN
jgi:hypothetical protein